MSPDEIAERFCALFEGLQRAHGEYSVPPGAKPDGQGKVYGTAVTVHTPVTVVAWARHLQGEESFGLGVTPIREDSTASWGAIDVDVYPLDVPAIDAQARRLGLPLVTCRTKSGGAHLYLFLSEPAPAALVRTTLMEWAIALGHPGVEVFPKQTRLASERDYGNWINMPYQANDRTVRYALTEQGGAATAEEFLEMAARRATAPQALEAWELPPDPAADMFLEGPPCLQALARTGFGDWQNSGMFNVCVYLRKRYGDDFSQHAADYNARLMDPPLSAAELIGVVKSVSKKSYAYMCKQDPIASACNRQVCLGREHGVGNTAGDPGVVFGELVKLETEPPLWIWDVDGARVELESRELMDQHAFHAKVISVLNKWPNMVKGPRWQGIVRERLAKVTVVPVPQDATKEGQWWVHLSDYCTSRVAGRSLDELLIGKPYTDAQRSYFRSSDFLSYLQQQRVTGVDAKGLYAWLRRERSGMSVQHHFVTLKGKGVNCWSVAAFSSQTEEHAVPAKPVEEM